MDTAKNTGFKIKIEKQIKSGKLTAAIRSGNKKR
jgi:hypothetical protein